LLLVGFIAVEFWGRDLLLVLVLMRSVPAKFWGCTIGGLGGGFLGVAAGCWVFGTGGGFAVIHGLGVCHVGGS